MIKIKQAFENLSKEEYQNLLDAPVWISLLAAYTTDGRISDAEREGAIKLAGVRSYSAPTSIREIYKKISANFPKRLKQLNDRLPEKLDDKKLYIKAQVKTAHMLLAKLDPDVAESLEANFQSFYKHVFNSDKSIFQYFALPIFSNHIDKQNKIKALTGS